MEKIVCAAIKFQMIGDEYFQIMCGKRHPDVFEKMFKLGIQYDKNTCVQGFLTSDDRFVNRRDVIDVAHQAGQLSAQTILQINRSRMRELFSEDIWPE